MYEKYVGWHPVKGVQGNCVPDLTVARGLLCLPPLVRMLRSRKKPFPLSLLVQFLQHERPYCTRVMYTNMAGRKPAHVRLLLIELLFPVFLSHPFPGPSGMDTSGRRLMCTAFHEASRDFFISLAACLYLSHLFQLHWSVRSCGLHRLPADPTGQETWGETNWN